MSPGRNDPCPCGSGRKYKRCCAEADARRDLTLSRLGAGVTSPRGAAGGGAEAQAGGRVLSVAPRGVPWEVDAIPLGAGIADTPDARPAAVLVGAAGVVLHADVVTRPPGEPDDVALLLARAVATAVGPGGDWPAELLVRHVSVAPALARAVAEHGVTVHPRPALPTLDDVATNLRAHLAGGPPDDAVGAPEDDELGAGPIAGSIADPMLGAESAGPMLVSVPDSWAAWGLPGELVADLFSAASRYFAAQPWTNLYNTEVLALTLPDDEVWTACILGNGGEQFGLSLYAEPEDFLRTVTAAHPSEAFRGFRDAVVTLDFDARDELPRGMRREIASAHWQIAGPDAYPRLWCFNTPAGGVSRAQARALVAALDAIARFTTANASVLATHPAPDPPLEWSDAETGVQVAYAGDVFGAEDLLWDPPEVLTLGGAMGAGADPAAVLRPSDDPDAFAERERAVLERFARWLGEGGKGRRALVPATVRSHAGVAEMFVECLTGFQGVGLAAVHELDVRAFLYDWFPRKVTMGRGNAMRVPGSLRRFFRFLEEREALVCPWAEPLLDDTETFALRWDEFPGGHWWDEAVQVWQAELARDLDARVLLASESLAGGERWGDTMGFDEARLRGELQRKWLAWRDEVIAAGKAEPAHVRRELVERQHAWEEAPHPEYGGRPPRAVVLRERENAPLPPLDLHRLP